MKRTLLFCCFGLTALVIGGAGIFRAHANEARAGRTQGQPFKFGGLRSFEIVPLETVSETSSNASIGDLNGDGFPDIVLVKGRHWQATSLIFFGDGKGHFTPGPRFPAMPIKVIRRRWRI